MQTFLVTYQTFVRPRVLLRRLFQRYDVPSDVAPERAATVRARVTVFLKYWIEAAIRDFVQVRRNLRANNGSESN